MDNTINFLSGWANGYQYILCNEKENEIKQGKNYYMASLFQGVQINLVANQILLIAGRLPQNPLTFATKVICQLSPFISIPACIVAASSKQGQYDVLSKAWNSLDIVRPAILPALPHSVQGGAKTILDFIAENTKLPETLSKRTVKVLDFMAEHTGDVTRVAMAVSLVALYALGHTVYAAAALAAISYQTVDNLGYVPHKISLFMENYMPTVSALGLTLGTGTWFLRLMGALSFATQASTTLSHKIHEKIDLAFRKLMSTNWAENNLSGLKMMAGNGPSLEEYMAPVVENKQLSFEEISHILQNPDAYELNPAHCSKGLIDESKLPKDYNFKELLQLFNSINWENKYSLLFNKVQDDERFLDYLGEKFPEQKEKLALGKEDRLDAIKNHIETLSSSKEESKEQFLAHWVREQMVELKKGLNDEIRMKGTQKDIEDAMNNCAVVLGHLKVHQVDQMDQEDILLKLAVEGGGYCSRGTKRASNEIVGTILQTLKGSSLDPQETYELKIKQRLQDARIEYGQAIFQQIKTVLPVPEQLKSDVHVYDIYRFAISYGLTPITKQEEREIDISKLLVWECYGGFRDLLFQNSHAYLHAPFLEKAELGIYINQEIQQNPNLTEEQKEIITEMWTSLTIANTRFEKLMLVMLGIMRKKQAI